MARSGYIKIPRSMFQTEEWKEKREFSRFEAMISMYEQASYTDGRLLHVRGADILLRRGQFFSTVRTLAAQWGWSPATVDRFLKKLGNSYRNSFRIGCETVCGTAGTVVTICKYDYYDDDMPGGDTADETQSETASETANGTYIVIKDSKKDCKKLKEIPTNQLVRDFKIACAQADRVEEAYGCFRELQLRGYFATEEGGSLPNEYKFLVWMWIYYPELQRKFEDPMITWQAREILREYCRDDISRVVERMANERGIEMKRLSVFYTLRGWLRRDFERLEREKTTK